MSCHHFRVGAKSDQLLSEQLLSAATEHGRLGLVRAQNPTIGRDPKQSQGRLGEKISQGLLALANGCLRPFLARDVPQNGRDPDNSPAGIFDG